MPQIPIQTGSGVNANPGASSVQPISMPVQFSTPDVPQMRRLREIAPTYQPVQAYSFLSRIGQAASGLALMAEDKANKKAAEQKFYEESMWVEKTYSAAERDWMQALETVGTAPFDGVVGTTMQLYDEYKEKALESAPTDRAKLQLERSLNTLGSKMLASTIEIEANFKVGQTVNDVNGLIREASDAISITKDPDVLYSRQKKLNDTVNYLEKNKKLPPKAIEDFRNSINGLTVSAAESMAAENPTVAKLVLDTARGISVERRTVAENKIRAAFESHEVMFKQDQRTLLDSHITQLEQTGTANSNFSMKVYESVMGVDAATAAKDMESVATTLYVGRSNMQGKTESEIATILQSYRPQPNDPKYGMKLDAYQKLQTYASEQVKMLNEDPFSYSLQDPIVRSTFAEYLRLSEAGDSTLTTSAMRQVMRQSLAVQESLGIPRDLQSVLPRGEQERIAAELNNASPQDVIKQVNNLIQVYGQYYPDVIRDIQRLPSGQRIDTGISLTALHIDKPWVTSFVTAMRAKPDDMKLDPQDFTRLKELTMTSPSLNNMRSVILSSNPELVGYANEFSESVQKFSQYLLSTGRAIDPRQAVELATEGLIDSEFSFGDSNGQRYAIRLSYDGVSGPAKYNQADVENICSAFEFAQENGLKGWSADKVMDLNTDLLGIPEGLSEKSRKALIDNVVSDKAFWSTNPSNDGLALMMPAVGGGSIPMTWKDGTPITYTFGEALEYYRSYVAPSRYSGVPTAPGEVGEYAGY